MIDVIEFSTLRNFLFQKSIFSSFLEHFLYFSAKSKEVTLHMLVFWIYFVIKQNKKLHRIARIVFREVVEYRFAKIST